MIGVFCALDLVLFYLFFEGGLIPMFLIIGVWGGKRRVYASFKFFLYTLLGSVLMLLAIMAMYWSAGTTNIADMLTRTRTSRPRCKHGCGWRSLPPLRSRCRCGRCIPGCPMRTWRRRRPDRWCWQAILLKTRRLRLHPLFAVDVPIGIASDLFACLIYTLSVVAIIWGPHLSRIDAGGREKTDCLFLGGAYGLRKDGHLFRQLRRAFRGRYLPDAVPWPGLGARCSCASGSSTTACTHARSAAYGGLVNNMPLYTPLSS